jgi:hypothetical protein
VAEREGFEPPCRLPGKTLSRRPRYDHFGTSPYLLRSVGPLCVPHLAARSGRRFASLPSGPRLRPQALLIVELSSYQLPLSTARLRAFARSAGALNHRVSGRPRTTCLRAIARFAGAADRTTQSQSASSQHGPPASLCSLRSLGWSPQSPGVRSAPHDVLARHCSLRRRC